MMRKIFFTLVVGLWVMAAANAFADCVESCPDGTTDFNGFCYTESGDEITITGYAGSNIDVEIPSVVNGKNVTSIGEEAFVDCESLISVTIPDSVTSIGNEAFSDCSSLTSVTISDSVISIGDWAFTGCSSLTNVTIPDSVTSIGNQAFAGCTSLSNIDVDPDNEYYSSFAGGLYDNDKSMLIQYPVAKTDTEFSIPDSVTSIGDGAFAGCTSLISVTIPDSVISIGDGAFEGCTSLTSVTIPDSVTSIGDWAFSGCSSLTSVTILASVTSIGDGAFAGCSSLNSVTIPDSVTSIGYAAFLDCTSLVVAYFLGDAPNMGEDVFYSTAPGFRVCHTAGAAGFDVDPWPGYNAQVCEQCEDNSDCSEGYACVDDVCVADQPPVFISEPLWVGPWMGLSSDPANPHKPQSQHILLWAYDDDRLACSGGVEVGWKYRPVALQDGEVVPLGDWVVKEPWRFLWFVWIETPGIAEIAGPGLFEFKMTATDCLDQEIDSEGFWGKRYYFQVD